MGLGGILSVYSLFELTLLDLRGPTPRAASLVLPPDSGNVRTFAADAQTRWAAIREGRDLRERGPHRHAVPRARVPSATLAFASFDDPTLRMIDVRGALPVVHTVTLPAPPRVGSITSDDDGHWAITTREGVVYASDATDRTALHPLGCRAP